MYLSNVHTLLPIISKNSSISVETRPRYRYIESPLRGQIIQCSAQVNFGLSIYDAIIGQYMVDVFTKH
jgi:hypothetical protein